MALTAFVVIALHHGLAVFQDGSAEQLKQRVVRALRLPCAGLALPAAPQDLGVRLQTFLHVLLGNVHLKCKFIFGDESECWAPGCPRSRHHCLRPDTEQCP